jgi:hypothetical protein
MRLAHATDETSYKVLYQLTMNVISLSDISIKTNLKQITRVELKLTNLCNTLERDYILCMMLRYLLPFHSQMTHFTQDNHFQCLYIIIQQRFFWRNVDRTFAGNIVISPWN